MIHVEVLAEQGTETVTFDTVYCEVNEAGGLLIFDRDPHSGDMLIRYGYAAGAWVEFGVT